MRRSGHLNMPLVLALGFLCSGKLDDLNNMKQNDLTLARECEQVSWTIWLSCGTRNGRYGIGLELITA